MAVGDTYYEIYTSGSHATSAATVHNLFGSYQGLSALSSREVVHIRLAILGGSSFYVGDPNNISNNKGIRFDITSALNLPAMRVGYASQLQFINVTAGANASVAWTVWTRG